MALVGRLSRWIPRLIGLQTAALGAAALGVAARWALSPAGGWLVPPGLLVLGGATAALLRWRRPASSVVGTAAATMVGANVLSRPAALERLDEGALGAAMTVEVLGVVLGLLAGLAVLMTTVLQSALARRASGQTLPWGRWAQVAGLLVLAPVCAEYLAAYDSSTGHPADLLGGLVIFVPLYGCSALLVREAARRAGLGWAGILLLGSAFGLLQAGVVDQSLFSPDYRGIESWQETYRSSVIGPLGLSASGLVGFVSGHALFSIGAPVALVEAARPAGVHRPWLGRPGLVLTALVWVGASALVLSEHLRTEDSHASAAQVAGALAGVALLVAAALRLGRPRPVGSTRPAPGVPALLAGALVVAVANAFAGETWAGVALAAGTLAVAAVGLTVLSGRVGWSPTHVVVVAAAPLLVRGLLAFTYPPLIGQVSDPAKYGHNAVMLGIVVLAAALALRPYRRRPAADQPGRPADRAPRVPTAR